MMTNIAPGELPTKLLNHLSDGRCRTIDEMEADLGLSRRQISDAATQLALRRFLCRMERAAIS